MALASSSVLVIDNDSQSPTIDSTLGTLDPEPFQISAVNLGPPNHLFSSTYHDISPTLL
jgi:hypothetical protein